jgi:hypothetical protein
MSQDIAYCTGKNCPKKPDCKRYMNQPIGDKYISRFITPPWDSKKKKCEHYIPLLSQGEQG